MKTVSIIGAGQLGSRHLQGLKAAQAELDIWVMDANSDSLQVAKERYDAVPSDTPKTVHFVESTDALPSALDLVIIATGSKPRAAIVKALLAHAKVTYLVLEKFLFPNMKEYDEVAHLFEEKKVKCWVNCPRRMWESYKAIKKLIKPEYPVLFQKNGKDWGICCNSVHFIDVWMYLAGDSSFTVNLQGMEPQVIGSKRNGYIELLGKERFYSSKGDELILGSFAEYDGDSRVCIKNGNNEIIINESTGEWTYNGEKHEDKTPFQSGLTGKLADELITSNTCGLTPYLLSSEYHKPFLKAVTEFVNRVQGTNSDSCPIT